MKSARMPLPKVPADLRRRGGLPDDVAAYVRRLILTGVLRPGTKIDQEAVCEALDVSRSPIREAIVILGQEGLLDVTPRRGASVALLTPGDIVDHYELFGVVSGRAAAMAAEVLDDERVAELVRIQQSFRTAPDNAPAADLSQLNEGFHRTINGCAPRRTRWLLRLLERSVPADYYEFANGWNARAVEHHQSILDAITAHDSDGARRAMEHHLHESGIAAAEALRAQGFWD
jgi:DNA-binding GntR family transcriptional regulator